MSGLQFDDRGQLRHLLTLEGLKRAQLEQLLDTADGFRSAAERGIKAVPLLRGRTVCTLFFEPSTRTRATFELAARRLSADVLNLDVGASSQAKGERLLDMLDNLEAMHIDMFVIRHPESGAAHFFAEQAAPGVSVLNAGDGRHAHPTQGLLDLYTIRRHKGNAWGALKVVIVGDVAHSRVARSLIHGLNIFQVGELVVVGPPTLLPAAIATLGVRAGTDLDRELPDADVIVMLRLQKERMRGPYLPSASEYYHRYGLTESRLAKARGDAIVMHPGPMNRGVEIESAVADGPRAVILDQVSNGLAVRMSVMATVLGARPGGSG